MANTAPATVTITGSTGPGQSVTSLKFTDVVGMEVDFSRNWITFTRAAGVAGPSKQYFDYSALATITWTISSGLSTLVFS